MIWDDAVKTCTDLLNGLRFPTDDELNLMNLNKDKISGFANDYYWSSSEKYEEGDGNAPTGIYAWWVLQHWRTGLGR